MNFHKWGGGFPPHLSDFKEVANCMMSKRDERNEKCREFVVFMRKNIKSNLGYLDEVNAYNCRNVLRINDDLAKKLLEL